MKFFNDHSVLARISSKQDGSCRLNPEEKDSIRNRAAFFEANGIPPESVAAAMLVHGSRVKFAQKSGLYPDTDGLITDKPQIYLSITVADCLPVFLYEPDRKMVGLLHAGWRGLAGGILENGVQSMVKKGADSRRILAAVGPSIGPCHFEVQEDVWERFKGHPAALSLKDGRRHIDLQLIAREVLAASGLRPENISAKPPCTACSPDYFSYRRDKPERLMAMAAVIGLRV